MTPDTRPIGVLTPDILATASHWCLYGNGIADARPSSLLMLRPPEFEGDLPLLTCEGECYWNDDSNWMCYPCTLHPDGRIEAEPWPVLDGEEEIEAWRGITWGEPLHGAILRNGELCDVWSLHDDEDGFHTSNHHAPMRPGYHPAPRKGGKWVWDADRC